MRIFLIFIAILSISLLAACSAGNPGQAVALDAPAAEEAASAGFDSILPAPLGLSLQDSPRQASAAGDQVFIKGEDFDDTLPNQNAFSLSFTQGMLLSGGWASSGDPADLSYGMFSFDLTGLDPAPRVRADWILGPYAGMAYVGVANFANNRWDWFRPQGGNVVELGSLTPYRDGDDRAVVVVLQAGDIDLTLGGISIGNQWSSETITDYGVFDEIYLSEDFELALVDGNPAVAYIDEDYESEMFHIRYTRALDGDGTSWGAPVDILGPLEGTGNISLAVVDGKPAIAWHDSQYVDLGEGFVSLGSLYFIPAMDAQGSAWGSSVLLDDGMGDDHGISPFLTVVNGRPAISYSSEDADGFSKGLMYVQASSADGSAWNAPVQVKGPVSGGYGIYDSPIAVIDGFPAIVYQAGLNKENIGYVRATDADGTDWSSGKTFFVSQRSGFSLFLMDVDGLPAMVYDQDNTNITYWRTANDADGADWNEPVTVYESGIDDPGSQPLGLVMLDGVPTVLIDQYNDNRLVLCRGTDAAGSAFSEPEHVTYTLEFSGNSEMEDLAGRPAFVFVNGGQLNFSGLE